MPESSSRDGLFKGESRFYSFQIFQILICFEYSFFNSINRKAVGFRFMPKNKRERQDNSQHSNGEYGGGISPAIAIYNFTIIGESSPPTMYPDVAIAMPKPALALNQLATAVTSMVDPVPLVPMPMIT